MTTILWYYINLENELYYKELSLYFSSFYIAITLTWKMNSFTWNWVCIFVPITLSLHWLIYHTPFKKCFLRKTSCLRKKWNYLHWLLWQFSYYKDLVGKHKFEKAMMCGITTVLLLFETHVKIFKILVFDGHHTLNVYVDKKTKMATNDKLT